MEQGGALVNNEKAAVVRITQEQLEEGVKLRRGRKGFHKAALS